MTGGMATRPLDRGLCLSRRGLVASEMDHASIR
jgi:hypothetical protein